MKLTVLGVVFILFGLLYLWKPTLYRRGIWMKTSIAIRALSEANYTRYMRVLGFIFIVAGIVLILVAAV
jgi:uncharacterized protein YjeT (DUF2065 family)